MLLYLFVRLLSKLHNSPFGCTIYQPIPKGKIRTYKQVAVAIKCPRAARAVANACAKNPYAPKIPCHRVIRSDGGLGGYSGIGGTKKKLKLLRSEKAPIQHF